ncbi:alpha beta [Diplodia corticola]|uniref:Alpha beta n=1 Tax=Diplodia corticola TaxID=236234 RepID=A0A1J9QW78_9PEZI|nr:alpha beta [Diplodia corticola]OJD32680.1 alpha beta [Diplodia corticola]
MPFLTIGYKRLHYTDYPAAHGSAARETIILHHGLGSSQNFYAPIVPALTAAGLRVITFDATGAGRSPYTQVEQSVASLAADVLGVLDALGVPKAIVGGHSMGGMVAAHLAAATSSADRVVAAVLIGPVYPSPAVAAVFDQRIATVERAGMEPLADAIPAAATAAGAPPLARAMVRELLLAQDPRGYVSNCRVIAAAARPAYEDVRVPVLLVAGAEDKSAPLDSCRKQFEELGTSEKSLEVLPGVGHWHCVEAPDAVGAKIVDFYRQIQ